MRLRPSALLLAGALGLSACQPPARPASIGTARMDEDGVLTVVVYGRANGRASSSALLIYRPDEPGYSEMLAHLQPIEPGQSKPVPPWPDEKR